MKRFSIALILALLAIPTLLRAQSTPAPDDIVTQLVVHLKDGTTHIYNLPDSPTASFEKAGAVTLTSKDVITEYDFAELSHFDFQTGTYGGALGAIGNVEGDDAATFTLTYLDANTVAVSGEGITHATLFNTSGQQVIQAKATGAYLEISLQGLPAGVYLLTTSTNKTVKIIKR